MRKYSLVSVNKWDLSNKQILMQSDKLLIMIRKRDYIINMIRYCKKLSPSKNNHRKSNRNVARKIESELHGWNGDISQLLSHYVIMVLDNETGILHTKRTSYLIVKGFIPNISTDLYIEESMKVKELTTLKSFNPNEQINFIHYECIYNF